MLSKGVRAPAELRHEEFAAFLWQDWPFLYVRLFLSSILKPVQKCLRAILWGHIYPCIHETWERRRQKCYKGFSLFANWRVTRPHRWDNFFAVCKRLCCFPYMLPSVLQPISLLMYVHLKYFVVCFTTTSGDKVFTSGQDRRVFVLLRGAELCNFWGTNWANESPRLHQEIFLRYFKMYKTGVRRPLFIIGQAFGMLKFWSGIKSIYPKMPPRPLLI